MKFLQNIPASTFTASAVAVGFLLIDDLTPAEQNSLGGWFMLVGQLLSTNASQQQVVNNMNNTSNSSNQHIVNDNTTHIRMMEKARDAFNQEINNLRK